MKTGLKRIGRTYKYYVSAEVSLSPATAQATSPAMPPRPFASPGASL
jgi:hypothetical protein